MNNGEGRGRLGGAYAALVTAVDGRGAPVGEEVERLAGFVLEGGVEGVVIGGATGEYPHFGVAERKGIVEAAARGVRGRGRLLTAIGAATMREVLELGAHAMEQGSAALLLPMPYFYKYEQEDLSAYVREVARTLEAPCLLYNLAAFTNPLRPETTSGLLQEEPRLVGLKDSSGDQEALGYLAARRGEGQVLLCGSDGLIFEALEAGWDGAISGIASCCPEVVAGLVRHHRAGRVVEARRCQRLLDELIGAVGRLPFPWSIRVAAEVRGFATGPFPFPLSAGRREEVEELRGFYEGWFEEKLSGLRVEAGVG